MNFYICKFLCNQHLYQDIYQFQHPRSFPLAPTRYIPSLRDNLYSDFYNHQLFLPVHIHEIVLYIMFYVWLIWFNIVFTFTHVILCTHRSFFLHHHIVWLCLGFPQFVYFQFWWASGCFPRFCCYEYQVDISICLQVFLWSFVCIFLKHIPRSRIIGS